MEVGMAYGGVEMGASESIVVADEVVMSIE